MAVSAERPQYIKPDESFLPNPKPGDQFIAYLPEPNGLPASVVLHVQIVGLASEGGVRKAELIVEGRYLSAAVVRELRRGRWGDCKISLIQNK